MGQRCTVGKGPANAEKGIQIPGLADGDQFSKDYQLGARFASKVLSTKHTLTKKISVVYKISKPSLPCQDPSLIKRRLDQVRELQHVNICHCTDVYLDSYFVLMIYDQTFAKPLIKQFVGQTHISEDVVLKMVAQILRALKAGEEKGLHHGAIAAKNVVLDNHGDVVLHDFGLAHMLKPAITDTEDIYTFAMSAPEVVQHWVNGKVDGKARNYKKQTEAAFQAEERDIATTAADVYSLGMLICLLLTPSLPFASERVKDLAEEIVAMDQQTWWAVIKRHLSMSSVKGELLDLVEAMLHKEPGKRPSLDTLLQSKVLNTAGVGPKGTACFEICTHLSTVHAESYFKKAMMRLLSERLPQRKIKELTQAFSYIDADGDGSVTLAEFRKGLKKHPNIFGQIDQGVDEIFNEIDHDHSGKISVKEFVAATLDSQEDLMESLLWETFKSMDKDGGGTLGREEILKVLTIVEGQLGAEHVQMIQSCIESEVQDNMNFYDFRHLMLAEGGRTDESRQIAADGPRSNSCMSVQRACSKCSG